MMASTANVSARFLTSGETGLLDGEAEDLARLRFVGEPEGVGDFEQEAHALPRVLDVGGAVPQILKRLHRRLLLEDGGRVDGRAAFVGALRTLLRLPPRGRSRREQSGQHERLHKFPLHRYSFWMRCKDYFKRGRCSNIFP